jgi:predicted lipoprotein with Yx(FWY)xxD motif
MASSLIKPRIHLIAALAGLLTIVAACSSAGGASSAPSTGASTPGASSAGGEIYEVTVDNGSVGAYLAGEDGKTLYTFKPDSANTSTCTDACAGKWPPFVVEADDTLKAGSGVTGKLTTFARSDGSMQVAYDGTPLYYYQGDTKAGDTTGQGVGDKWFVATPTGAAPASAAPATAAPSKGGGYEY